MAQKPKRTKSGRAWMHEHVTDPYVKKAQIDGYRSRAAYKLLEIDARDRLLKPGMTVVPGAAPGSWCQVAVQRMKGQGRVLAIDLLPVASMPGVESLEGDFHRDGGAGLVGTAIVIRPGGPCVERHGPPISAAWGCATRRGIMNYANWRWISR